MTYLKEAENIKAFLLAYIFDFFPAILKELIVYEDVYWKLLKALWIWIGDALANAKPAPPPPPPKK